MSHAALAQLLAELIARWGARPDVLAVRLAGELASCGLAIVPTLPTAGMIRASRRALSRNGPRRVGEDEKHALRIADAIARGAIECRMAACREGADA